MAGSLSAGRVRGGYVVATIALIASCGAVLAQPAASSTAAERAAIRAWAEARDRYEAAIADESSRNGPQSRAQLDPLVSLALLHQEHGEHALADEALGRALHVLRVNDGLYAFEQAPLLLLKLASAISRGDGPAVAALESELSRLVSLNAGDLRTVPILQVLADRRMAEFERFLAGDIPPTFSFNVSMGPYDSPPPLVPITAPTSGPLFALGEARRNYGQAIRTILLNGEPTDENLPRLERALIRSYYLGVGGCGLGQQSYARLVVYYAKNSGAAVDVARTLIELADWEVMCGAYDEAHARYEQAYALLVAENVPDAAISELLPSDRPVLLPTFRANPFAQTEAESLVGHIDLRFEVSKYGSTRKIESDVSAKELKPEARRLARTIVLSRFRPQLIDGKVGGPVAYEVRVAR